MVSCRQKVPIRGVLVVIGGFVIHLTIGTQLTFGNTNPYFVSYIRKNSSPSDLKYVDGIWVQACMLMGQGVTMFLGGMMEQKLGPRIACLLGSWFMSAGVWLTYWTLKVNYVTSVLTYGAMFGLGCGIAYPMPVTCAMKWFPGNRGLVGGVIFVGYGLGSTIFNQIITLYLNPHNLLPDLTVGEDVYFTTDKVLDRVPSLFLVLGGTYSAMQLVGVILMVNPPASQEESTIEMENKITTETQNDMAKRTTSMSPNEDTQNTGEIWHTENNIPASTADVANGSATVNGERPTSTNRNLYNKRTNGTTTTTGSDPVLLSVKDVSVNYVSADESLRVEDGREAESGSAVESSRQIPDTHEAAVCMDIPPLQMLRNKQFYIIWLLFLFGGMGGVFMASMYKSYGQSFIKDDQFIAIVGSCAAVFNALGGIVWGHVADRFSFHIAAKILYTLFACTSFTFIGSEMGMKPYFLIWVCLILFAISGKFTIMPPVIARMFGNKYMSINYGLLYTSQILTAAASAFMGQMLKDILHYNGLFFLIGGMSCIGFILTFFVDARTPDGKKI